MFSSLMGTVWQLALSMGLGAAIGLERQLRGRAAGLRTMILVCLGATLVTMVSSELIHAVDGDSTMLRVDPGRIAAGIVTGIGFLGAGVIIKLGDVIRGVTTAATIWFVAGVGIAVGEQRYVLATLATVAALAVLALLQVAEGAIPGYIYRILTVDAEPEHGSTSLEAVLDVLKAQKIRVMDLKATNEPGGKETRMRLHIRARQCYQALALVERVSAIEGVVRASWH